MSANSSLQNPRLAQSSSSSHFSGIRLATTSSLRTISYVPSSFVATLRTVRWVDFLAESFQVWLILPSVSLRPELQRVLSRCFVNCDQSPGMTQFESGTGRRSGPPKRADSWARGRPFQAAPTGSDFISNACPKVLSVIGDFATISVFLASAQSSAYPASEANLPIVAEPEPAGTPGRPNVIGRYVDVEGGMKNEVQTTATHGR